MEKNNILICLEKLDIGGVETAVLNLASVLLETGHKVIILAQKGIQTEALQKKGAICIEFEFTLEYNFNEEKTMQIIKIINDYKIQEVHIHQLPCLLSVFPACLITNTPYIAYAHNSVGGVYEWFMETFPVYKLAIPSYYKYAYKIIVITHTIKQDIIKRFQILEDKILVINNSISFEEPDKLYTKKQNNCNKFLIISRFAKEKKLSIYNSIDLFCEYTKQKDNAILNIIGDGELKEEIEKYIENKQIQNKVTLIGATNKVLEKINESDIILALDRCILEAISMKKLAIISGYDQLKELITIENIEKASQGNFSGDNLKSHTIQEIIKQLNNLTSGKIEEIVTKNYEYAKQHLNIKNNFYIINEPKTDNYSTKILNILIQIQEKEIQESKDIEQLKKELKKEKENIEEININFQKQIETLNKNNILEQTKQQRKIEELEKELTQVYNSKRWKYTEKISKIFH